MWNQLWFSAEDDWGWKLHRSAASLPVNLGKPKSMESLYWHIIIMATIYWVPLCARHLTSSHLVLWGRYCHWPHFICEEAKAGQGQASCSRWHSLYEVGQGSSTGHLAPELICSSVMLSWLHWAGVVELWESKLHMLEYVTLSTLSILRVCDSGPCSTTKLICGF